eukprot:365756-Chlamydomonas_euryale.AAC.19
MSVAAQASSMRWWRMHGIKGVRVGCDVPDFRPPLHKCSLVHTCHTCLVLACAGYLSGLLSEGTQPSSEALASAGWPASTHIIGKV